MLSKIYYGLGAGLILLYLLSDMPGLFSRGGVPQNRPLGLIKINRGKYIPPSSYPSSSNPSYSSGGTDSGGRYRSYPSGGGYSGGK